MRLTTKWNITTAAFLLLCQFLTYVINESVVLRNTTESTKYDCVFDKDFCTWISADNSPWEIHETDDTSNATQAPFSMSSLKSPVIKNDPKCVTFMFTKTGKEAMLNLQSIDQNNRTRTLFQNNAGDWHEDYKKTVSLPLHNIKGQTLEFLGSSYDIDHTYLWLYFVKLTVKGCPSKKDMDYFGCHFDEDLCHWKTTQIHPFTVKTVKDRDTSVALAPPHACSTLTSPLIPPIPHGCMRFSYTQQSNEEKFSITLKAKNKKDNNLYNGARPGGSIGYYLFENSPFSIEIKGCNGMIVSYVTLSNDPCSRVALNCTFQSKHFCDWSQSTYGSWKVDESYGNFTAVNQGKAGVFLKSPEVAADERGYCFLVKLDGAVSILQLVDSKVKKNITVNAEMREYRFDFDAETSFKVKIVALKGDVHVQHVNFIKGTCGDSAKRCSFRSKNWCGYANVKTNRAVHWKRAESLLNQNGKIIFDHTSNSTGGYFLSLQGSSPIKQREILNSPLINVNKNGSSTSSCVRFWYNMGGGSFLRVLNDKRELWGHQSSTDGEWNGMEITVMSASNFRLSYIGYVTKSYVAIDDISVTNGDCKIGCSFSKDLCTWSNIDRFQWKVGYPSDADTTGAPQNDVNHKKSGGYLYLDAIPNHKPFDRARIKSRYFSKRKMPSCVLFMFDMNGAYDAKLNVYLSQSDKETLLWSLNVDSHSSKSGSWTKATAPIPKKTKGYIIIEGFFGENEERTMAIDSISFSRKQCGCEPEDCHPSGKSTIHPTGKPPPQDTNDCNFEYGTCNWKFLNRYTWNRISEHAFLRYGPPNDHTSKSNTGHFVYVNMARNANEDMCISNIKSGFNCLQFYMFIGGLNLPEVRIITISKIPSGSKTPILKTHFIGHADMITDQWLKYKVTTDSATSHRICFHATTTSSTDGLIAVDDITFDKGQCYDSKDDPKELCSFDYGGKCGYSSTNWKLSDEYSYNTGLDGPGNAMVAQGPMKKTGKLLSPKYRLGSGKDLCLTFRAIFKLTTGKLSVGVLLNKNFTGMKSFNGSHFLQDGKFKQVEVPIKLSKKNVTFQFEFNAVNLAVNDSIVVDDVQLIDGRCSDVDWCNFEASGGSICKWSNDDHDIIHWTIGSGKTSTESGGPLLDKTTNSDTGHYLHLPTDVEARGKSSRFISQLISSKTFKTLTFFYHMHGKDIGTLKVKVKSGGREATIWQVSGEQEHLWTPAHVPLQSKTRFKVVIEGILGNAENGDIAIDDIMLDSKTYPPTRPEYLPTKDIGEIADCTFDDGTFCKWSEVVNTKIPVVKHWVFGNEIRKSIIGPEQPVNGKGQYIFTDPSYPKSKDDIVFLVSPVLPAGERPVCFSLWYHIFGEEIGSLEITLNYVDFDAEDMKPFRTILRRTTSIADRWHLFQASLKDIKFDYKIKIKAGIKCTDGPCDSNIAIDNIKMTQGICPSSDLCDFTSDMCGWMDGMDGWKRTDSIYDHTTDTKSGVIVASNKGSRLLKSIWYPPAFGPHCLSFWCKYSNVGRRVDLKVALEYEHNSKQTVWKRSSTNFDWLLMQINIFNTNRKFRINIEANILDDNLVNVYLDDLKLSGGSCSSNIGDCDFSESFCAFHSPHKSKNHWLLGHGRVLNPDFISRIPHDHTSGFEIHGAEGGMFAYVDFTAANGSPELISPWFKPQNVSCLTFYYVAYGKDRPQLSIKQEIPYSRHRNGSEDIIWSSPSLKESKEWTQIKRNVVSESMHAIVFSASSKNGRRAMIALDDVKFEAGNCSDDIISTVAPETYILEKCDFSKGFCDWSSNSSQYDWSINFDYGRASPYLPKFTYPREYFAYVNFHSKSSGVYDLTSKSVAMFKPMCLSFFYYMFGPKVGRFSVSQVSTKTRVIWQKTGSQGDSWRQAFIQVNGDSQKLNISSKIQDYPFTLHLRISSGMSFIGVLAIDDLQLVLGDCEQQESDICTFEDGTMCGFSQSSNSGLYYFIANDSNIPKDYEGNLLVDHTIGVKSGGFLVLKLPSESTNVVYNRLFSPVRRPTPGSCLKFWYHIEAKSSEITINAYRKRGDILGQPIWGIYWGHTNYWQGASVNFESDVPYQIVLEILHGADTYGNYLKNLYVAIDDVEISHDECSKESFCTFENGRCMWTHQSKESDAFLLTSSRDLTDKVKPSVDVTTERESGHYLYHNFLNGLFEKVSLASPVFSIVGERCLNFWVYVSTRQLKKFSIIINTYTVDRFVNISESEVPVHTVDKWELKQIPVKAVNKFIQMEFLVYYFGTGGSAIVAIDDISVENGNCHKTSETFDCQDGQKINIDHVCNWVKNCDNNRDEKFCGKCDFSDGLCHWNITSSYNDYGRPMYKIVKFQHTNNSVLSMEYGDLTLTGPTLRPAPETCFFHFSFYAEFENDLYVSMKESPDADFSSAIAAEIWTFDNKFSDDEITNGDYENVWNDIRVYVGHIANPFQLSIIRDDYEVESKVFIDNIYFSGCNLESKASCDNTEFHCKTTKVCISKDKICDLLDDCGDGSDEINCNALQCDFESSMCDWSSSDDADSYVWSRVEARDYSYRDHTTGLTTGHYLISTSNSYYTEGLKMAHLYGPTFEPSTSCKIRFYCSWFEQDPDGNISELTIKTINHITGKYKIIWSSDSKFLNPLSGEFFHVVVSFNEPSAFQVIIEGDAVYNTVILDDISFDPSCVPKKVDISPTIAPSTVVTMPAECNSHQFQCALDSKCIPVNQACDFHCNCIDCSDEDNCANCDFEIGLCGWVSTSEEKYIWTREQSKQFYSKKGSTVPSFDATTGSGGGWIVALDHKNAVFLNPPAYLSTPKLGATSENCKFFFTYSLNGKGDLRVFLSKYDTVYSVNALLDDQVFVENSKAKYNWNNVVINVGEKSTGYQIRIRGNTDTFLYGKAIDIAIDNTYFSDCDPSLELSDTGLTCDFESRGSCSWKVDDQKSSFQWLKVKPSKYFTAGPAFDHNFNKGSFMYLDFIGTSKNSKATMTAEVASKYDNDHCLGFYYYMFGENIGSFTVYTKSKNRRSALWMKTGSHGESWYFVHLNVPASNNSYTISFEGSSIGFAVARIAVDEITFNVGSCPASEECTFDNGFCGWVVDGSNNKPMITTGSKQKSPTIDHTDGTSSGHYLLMKRNDMQMESKTSRIEYGSFKRAIDRCLIFWCNIHGNATSLLANQQSSKDGKWEGIFGIFGFGVSQGVWSKQTVNVASDAKSVSIEAVFDTLDERLAIDDISILDGRCPLKGSCSFEDDTCEWKSNRNSTDPKWLRVSPHMSEHIPGPSLDVTTYTNLGWYIVLDASSLLIDDVATLTSERLMTNPKTRFSLYYQTRGHGISWLRVYAIHDGKSNVIYEVINPNEINWHKVDAPVNAELNSSGLYQYQIKARISGIAGYIAIDEINIYENKSETTPPTREVKNVWECNFEKDCHWSKLYNAEVVNHNFKSNANYTSFEDHTTSSSKGHYLMLCHDSSKSNTGTVVSHKFSVGRDFCLKFWYRIEIYGSSLTVLIKSGKGIPEKYWVQKDSTDRNWNYAQIHVKKSKSVSVSFVSHINRMNDPDDVVAIDDVALNIGSCPKLYSIDCQFESKDLCGYKLESPDKFMWHRGYGRTTTNNTGPSFDHTYGTAEGHYMYIDSSQAGSNDYNNLAHLVSPEMLPSDPPKCIQFWYMMFGTQVHSLNVYIREPGGSLSAVNKVWSEHDSVGDQWLTSQFTDSTPYKHEIVFEAVSGIGAMGDIAIDDIRATVGACLPPGTCDFEDGLCTWIDVLTDQIGFSSVIAKTVKIPGAPRHDAGLHLGSGSYLLVSEKGVDLPATEVMLKSELFSSSVVRRFSFWYFMLGKASLKVKVSSSGRNDTRWNQTADGIKLWRRGTVMLLKMSGYYYQLLMVAELGDKSAVVGLDNFVVDSGNIPVLPPGTLDCRDGIQSALPASLICDFKSDCNNDMDERVCADCNFNSGWCGWVAKSNDVAKWKHTSPFVDDGLNLTDRTFKKNAGSYLYFKGKPGTLQSPAIITAPVYKYRRARHTCRMVFYYAFGQNIANRDARLVVSVNIDGLKVERYRANFKVAGVWKKAEVQIGYVTTEWKVEIAAEMVNSAAVDDVKMLGCGYSSHGGSCSDDWFECPGTGICVEKRRRCDLTNDCPDGFDESRCDAAFRCTFEDDGSYCDWTSSRSPSRHDRWFSVRSSGNKGRGFSGPYNDHTVGLDNAGHYLATSTSWSDKLASKDRSLDLVSSSYSVSPKSECRLTFYYYMFGDGIKSLTVYERHASDGRWKPGWIRNGDLGQQWFRGQLVAVAPNVRFKIVAITNPKRRRSATIAIDDISLSDGCRRMNGSLPKLKPGSSCENNEFECLSGATKCIPKDLVCNFMNDCADGSDELECGPCNFEVLDDPLCGWIDASAGDFKWKLYGEKYAPVVDEKWSSSYIETTGTAESYSLPARLDSPVLPRSSRHCTISFWYKLGDLSVEALHLVVGYKVFHAPKLLVLNKWIKAEFAVGARKDNWQASILVHASSGRPVILVDDITFSMCHSRYNPIDCNFDDFNDHNGLCWWRQEKVDAEPFVRSNDPRVPPILGLITDDVQSRSYYLYRSRHDARLSRLISPVVRQTNASSCFSFWYYMRGLDPGEIRVTRKVLLPSGKTKTEALFSARSKQDDRWNQARIVIDSVYDFVLNVDAVPPPFVRLSAGIIAVDDIRYSRGSSCPFDGTCTFESDDCGWIYSSTGEDWLRTNGSVNAALKSDHTYSTAFGNYLYTSGGSNPVTAVMTTASSISTSRSFCLQFWFVISLSDYGSITVYKNAVNSSVRTSLWTTDMDRLGIWRFARVNVRDDHPYRLAIEGHVKAYDKTKTPYLAIDDLTFKEGRCTSETFCSFEYGTCGWNLVEWHRMKTTDFQSWKEHPEYDRTTYSKSGYYLYTYVTSNSSFYRESFIESPEIHSTEGEIMCLSFYYYNWNAVRSMLTVQQHFIGELNVTLPSVRVNSSRVKEWNRARYSILSFDRKAFTVIIKAELAKNTTGFGEVFAIDDIGIATGPCETSTTKGAVATTPVPPTEKPLTFENFESTSCRWKSVGSEFQRVIGMKAKNHEFWPRIDRTTSTSSGHYMIAPSCKAKTCILSLTDDDVVVERGSCFEMWFYLFSYSSSSLSVVFTDSKVSWIVWRTSYNSAPNWHRASARVRPGRYQRVQIMFKSSSYLAAVAAVDDISIDVGNCPPTDKCTFEDDMCGYLVPYNFKNRFVRTEASRGLGPHRDHSKGSADGHYLFLANDASDSYRMIVSPKYPKEMTCLRFWYYIRAPEPSSEVLSLYLQDFYASRRVWYFDELTRPQWNMAQVRFETNENFNLMFVSTSRNDSIEVAIDDVQLLKECPPVGSCDFETDMCAWTNDPEGTPKSVNWVRSSSVDYRLFPASDHTYGGNEGGIFLLVESVIGYSGVLQSAVVGASNDKCFRFWFWKKGQYRSNLELYVRTANETDHLVDRLIWTDGTFTKDWSYRQLNISNDRYGNFYRLHFKVTFLSSQAEVVALDDLSMKDGVCDDSVVPPTKYKYRCDGKKITEEQICNFYKDCPDGRDEAHCGYPCSFEDGMCGWRTISGNVSVFESRNESRPNHFIRATTYSALLSSPIFQNAFKTCIVTFKYRFVAHETFRLKQMIRVSYVFADKGYFYHHLMGSIASSGKRTDWIQGSIDVGHIDRPFRIVLNVDGNGENFGVDVDDIDFVNCSSSVAARERACDSEQFKCKSGRCISKDLLCDYSDDCGDSSDENGVLVDCDSYPGRCSFEGGFCDWNVESDSLFGWRRKSGFAVTGVYRDHTINSGSGHVGYHSSYPHLDKRSSSLISPYFIGRYGCSLRFYSYGNVFASASDRGGFVNVYTAVENGTWHPHGKIVRGNPDYYQRNVVDLSSGEHEKFRVRIEVVTSGSVAFVAIDDISFSRECEYYNAVSCGAGKFSCLDGKTCVDENLVCDLKDDCSDGSDEYSCPHECDFEDSLDPTCQWSSSGNRLRVVSVSEGSKDSLCAPDSDANLNSNGDYLALNSYGSNVVFKSPNFRQSSTDCEIRFKYVGCSAMPNIRIRYYYGSNVGLVDSKQFPPVPSDNQWRTVAIGIGRQRYSFHVEFELPRVHYDRGYTFLLDNIAFKNCGLPKNPTACPVSRFRCFKTKACISKDLLCDLSDDCGDNSDETIGLCKTAFEQENFERSTSKLFRQGVDKVEDDFDWVRTRASDENNTYGPLVDHTYFRKKGHYMSMSSKPPRRYNQRSWLVSKDVYVKPKLTKRCSVVFYAYRFGRVGRPTLMLRFQENGPTVKIPSRSGNESADDYERYSWTRYEHVVDDDRPFEIIIEGKCGVELYDSISLDDVSISCTSYNGKLPVLSTSTSTTQQTPIHCSNDQYYCKRDRRCIDSIKVCDFYKDCSDGGDESNCASSDCSFDDGNLCGWKIRRGIQITNRRKRDVSHDSVFQWKAVRPTSLSDYAEAPHYDHSKSVVSQEWFLLADARPGKKEDFTDLVSPVIGQTGPRCKLNFWFYLRGPGMSMLVQVIAANGTERDVFFLAGDYGNRWYEASSLVGHVSLSRLLMKAIRGPIPHAALAIDDVKLVDCAMPPHPVVGVACAKDEFACSDGSCIPRDRLCDYADDCLGGDDEMSDICNGYYGRCDFQHGLCTNGRGWRVDEGSDLKWKSVCSSQGHVPTYDHNMNQGCFYEYQASSWSTSQKAGLKSYVISGKVKTCKLRFWTYVGLASQTDKSHLRIYKRIGYWSAGQKMLLDVPRDASLMWRRIQVETSGVTGSQNYEIVIAVESSRSIPVIVDDVSLTSDCTPAVQKYLPGESGTMPTSSPGTGCWPDKYECANGHCYRKEQRCNFVDDCKDKTDEILCGSDCDFENGLCGWFNGHDSDLSWIRIQGNDRRKGKFSGPSTDHTLQNPKGHYLLMPSVGPSYVNRRAFLHSEMHSSSSHSCVLQFWYSAYSKFSNDMGHLQVIVKTVIGTKQIWRSNATHDADWKKATAKIGNREEFVIVFEAVHGESYHSDVALDDIKFIDCASAEFVENCGPDEFMCTDSTGCIPSYRYCDKQIDCYDQSDELNCHPSYGDCNFDSPDLKMCLWKSDSSSSDVSWQIGSSLKNGPPHDHSPRTGTGTDGRFLYVDSEGQVDGATAMLTGPTFNATHSACHMSFFYYMSGSKNVGSLQVYLRSDVDNRTKLVWELNGDQGARWKHAELSWWNPQNYRVQILAEIEEKDGRCSTAIDDIHFSKHCSDGGSKVPVVRPPCLKSEFTCSDNSCIPIGWKCDCSYDCVDGSDETNCGELNCKSTGAPKTYSKTVPQIVTSSPVTPIVRRKCKRGYVDCTDADNTCIPAGLVCDGVKDCPNGHDEKLGCPVELCKTKYYYCRDGGLKHCLPQQLICNGVDDCSDSSDESLCDGNCTGSFCQNNGKCTVKDKKLATCSCTGNYTGNRCVHFARPLSKTSPHVKVNKAGSGWIAAVVVSILVTIALVGFAVTYKIKKLPSGFKFFRRNGGLLHSINNPVYDSFNPDDPDFQMSEPNTEIHDISPKHKKTRLKNLPSSIENPLHAALKSRVDSK
ncbi:Uncharacterised protein g7537 [Pycnogonum litorale]